MGKNVLLIGWSSLSTEVDYSKFPGLTPEKLRVALLSDQEKLNALGYNAEWVYLMTADAAVEDVVNALGTKQFDIVLVGAGVRKNDNHFLMFEKLLNAIHEHAPHAKIALNTNPSDTAEAVMRWG